MLDKVEYWLELCEDDLKAAKAMFKSENFLWMGFICHIIAEKALKAVVQSVTGETPPKIHKLKKLAVIANIFDNLSEEQLSLLDKLDPLQMETRYPEYKSNISKYLSNEYCKNLLKETEDFLCWIKKELGK